MASLAGKVIGMGALALAVGALGLLAFGPGGAGPLLGSAGDDAPADGTHAKVTVNGRVFNCELALDNDARFKGLSGRTDIPAEGGMLFVFPDYAVGVQDFVMRDCPVPIDIIYLDGSGRVQASYQMQVEPPRGPEEGKPGEINMKYEQRLKRYSSRFPSQFVIELKGGTLPSLNLQTGQKVELDAGGLKKRAK